MDSRKFYQLVEINGFYSPQVGYDSRHGVDEWNNLKLIEHSIVVITKDAYFYTEDEAINICRIYEKQKSNFKEINEIIKSGDVIISIKPEEYLYTKSQVKEAIQVCLDIIDNKSPIKTFKEILEFIKKERGEKI